MTRTGATIAEFIELPFPEQADIVYVLCFKPQGSCNFTPFYVGESTRSIGRIGDFVSAKFTASNDFKVGKAVKKLRKRGCEVVIRYKPTNDRRNDKTDLIDSFEAAGLSLLNDLPGYDYKLANERKKLQKVEAFIDELVRTTSTK